MKEYHDIYTGEKVANWFESVGFKYYSDNKIICINYNGIEKVYEFSTNTEFTCEDFKFIVCSNNNKEFTILFNVEMEGSIAERLRSSFVDDWTYFKCAYEVGLNQLYCFKYLNKEIKFEIRG